MGKKFLSETMVPTGASIRFDKLTFPDVLSIGDTNYSAYVHDAETACCLALNSHALRFHCLEDAREVENKDPFFYEKRKQEISGSKKIRFAHKVIGEYEQTKSSGKVNIFTENKVVDENGYCIVRPIIRVPLYRGNKIKAIFSSFFDLTKNEYIEDLYNRYKDIYSDDMKLGNKLFLEYIGLPTQEYCLTTKEIETLIALTKHRTAKGTAAAMNLNPGTIEGYLHNIKNRLRNFDLSDVLIYFSTNKNRKF